MRLYERAYTIFVSLKVEVSSSLFFPSRKEFTHSKSLNYRCILLIIKEVGFFFMQSLVLKSTRTVINYSYPLVKYDPSWLSDHARTVLKIWETTEEAGVFNEDDAFTVINQIIAEKAFVKYQVLYHLVLIPHKI